MRVEKEKYYFTEAKVFHLTDIYGNLLLLDPESKGMVDYRGMRYRRMQRILEKDLPWTRQPTEAARFFGMTDEQINYNKRCDVLTRLVLALFGQKLDIKTFEEGDALDYKDKDGQRIVPMSETIDILRRRFETMTTALTTSTCIRDNRLVKRRQHALLDVPRLFDLMEALDKARRDNAEALSRYETNNKDSSLTRSETPVGKLAKEALKNWRTDHPGRQATQPHATPFPLLKRKVFDFGSGKEPVRRTLFKSELQARQEASSNASTGMLGDTSTSSLTLGTPSSGPSSGTPSSPLTPYMRGLRDDLTSSPLTEFTDSPGTPRYELEGIAPYAIAPADNLKKSLIVKLPGPHLILDQTNNKKLKLAAGSSAAVAHDDEDGSSTPVRKGRDKPRDAGGDVTMSDFS